MDIIERIFHIAPDGGSGATELAILLAAACVAAGVLWLRRRARI
jgi:hypothetical protein